MNKAIPIVLILVIVVVVAALLMSQPAQQPAQPEQKTQPAEQEQPEESTQTTGTEQTSGTTPPSGIDYMGPVECTISGQPSDGSPAVTSHVKMEYPKMRSTTQMGDTSATIITADGRTYYMNMYGDSWIETNVDEVETPDPDTIVADAQSPPQGWTYDCRAVADIPDSEFQLPPGAQVLNIEDMMGGGGLPEGFEMP